MRIRAPRSWGPHDPMSHLHWLRAFAHVNRTMVRAATSGQPLAGPHRSPFVAGWPSEAATASVRDGAQAARSPVVHPALVAPCREVGDRKSSASVRPHSVFQPSGSPGPSCECRKSAKYAVRGHGGGAASRTVPHSTFSAAQHPPVVRCPFTLGGNLCAHDPGPPSTPSAAANRGVVAPPDGHRRGLVLPQCGPGRSLRGRSVALPPTAPRRPIGPYPSPTSSAMTPPSSDGISAVATACRWRCFSSSDTRAGSIGIGRVPGHGIEVGRQALRWDGQGCLRPQGNRGIPRVRARGTSARR